MEMGKYVKAYHVRSFRRFEGWHETSEAKTRSAEPGGETSDAASGAPELSDDDVLYLQENYVVTQGIFKDDEVVFEEVTDEWKRYCTEVLEFRIPDYVESPEGRGG